MSASMLRENRRLQAEAEELLVAQTREHHRPMAKYEGKPGLYAEVVLGVKFWPAITEVLEAVEKPPYRVLVKSGHKIGKTFALAAFINYCFDTYDPGVVVTTGASYEAMEDTVWSEVRMQRSRAGLEDFWIGPVAPELFDHPEHWAKLFSVNNATSFQGKHRGRMFFVFDEAVGVVKAMFTVAESMFKAEPGFGWICCCNPTDASSQVFVEENSIGPDRQPKWKVFTLSSLEHPNIIKQREHRAKGIELTSKDLDIPSAVSITQVDAWVMDWCLAIDPAARHATDFLWTFADGSQGWFRPQMDWEARCEGRWPTSATSSVWSDYLFTLVTKATASVPIHLLPEIGADCARFGDDKSTVHARWGGLSLSHGARQGLRTTELAGWLMETASGLADMVNDMRKKERKGRSIVRPQEIPMKVDDDGVGGGTVDLLHQEGYAVQAVNAGSTPQDPARYLNKRSELWFSTVRRAAAGGVAFCSKGADGISYSRLDAATVARLKIQALAPKFKMWSKGQRVVEKKEETKARIGYSPDDCFIAGTLILTASGNQPVETIKNGTLGLDARWLAQGHQHWHDGL